jgi:hypothetical protein
MPGPAPLRLHQLLTQFIELVSMSAHFVFPIANNALLPIESLISRCFSRCPLHTPSEPCWITDLRFTPCHSIADIDLPSRQQGTPAAPRWPGDGDLEPGFSWLYTLLVVARFIVVERFANGVRRTTGRSPPSCSSWR